jgi:hypothetical protein
MIFIPAKQADYNKLVSTTRKGSFKRTSGAQFIASEREVFVTSKTARKERISAEYENTRLVYVSK